jgi:hypothetical protein
MEFHFLRLFLLLPIKNNLSNIYFYKFIFTSEKSKMKFKTSFETN